MKIGAEMGTPIVYIYQSGGLYKHVLTLIGMYDVVEQSQKATIAIASFLTAAAAVEAIIVEASVSLSPTLYKDNNFLRAGAPKKYESLMGSESEEVKAIWAIRIALAHAEPENTRTARVGEHLNSDSLEKLKEQLKIIISSIHGDTWPDRYN